MQLDELTLINIYTTLGTLVSESSNHPHTESEVKYDNPKNI